MKNFILIFIILMLPSCSFDNKTGIWQDASNFPVDNQDTTSIENSNLESRYEDVYAKQKIFNEEIILTNNIELKLEKPMQINNWLEKYGSSTNNISNFLYNGSKLLLSKSPKLKKTTSSENVVFYENNLISHDRKGKIFVYSLNLKKKIFEYDFYRKNFKKIKKEIFLTIKENILYAADNLGYIYALDINNKSLIWAKNFGIPFRSNIKIIDDKIFVSNQDNVVYALDSKTGNKNWEFQTSLTFLKSDFKNNLAIDQLNNNLFILNTSGELYSINYNTQKINWFLNFKKSSLTGDTSLFLSNPIVLKNNNLIISTDKAILSYNSLTGENNWNFPSNASLKPILTNNYTFIFSKNNLLICLENITGKVLWSKNVTRNLRAIKLNNKIKHFHDFKMVNNELNFFSKNGYLLIFNKNNGKLQSYKKISKNGINSKIYFIKKNMLLIDNNNKLLKFN
jgi:outer membrane protein assembly factor BamB